jgi:hypothetical protein
MEIAASLDENLTNPPQELKSWQWQLASPSPSN